MELHTLGVDGGYTQQDVHRSRARLHRLDDRRVRARAAASVFEPRMHDAGPKMVLGHTIKAGGGRVGRRAGARHPGEASVDRDVHRRPSWCAASSPTRRRRRSSIAPPRRFRDTDGDIREVVRTILTSPEFFSAEAYRAKVKTPFEFVVSARCARPAPTSPTRLPLVAGGPRRSACRSTCASRRPAIADTRRRVGQHRRAAQPHELRAAADVSGTDARRPADGHRPGRRARRAASTTCSAATLRRHAATIAQGAPARQTAALMLGSPEFQHGRTAMYLSTRLHEERRPGAAQPRVRAGVPRADGRGRGAARRKVLVTIFQRGAVDGLNMVVPFGERDYYASRPSIAMPRPGNGADGAVDLDGFFGLHPRHGAAEAALGLRASSPSSTPADRPTDALALRRAGLHGDGDAGREEHAGRLAESLPARAASSRARRPSAPSRSRRSCRARCRASSPRWRSARSPVRHPRRPGDRHGAGVVRIRVRRGRRQGCCNKTGRTGVRRGASMLKRPTRPSTSPRTAPSIRDRATATRCGRSRSWSRRTSASRSPSPKSGGWDTHVNQGSSDGQLASRLDDFSRGIAALARDLGDRMADVVILTMSSSGGRWPRTATAAPITGTATR